MTEVPEHLLKRSHDARANKANTSPWPAPSPAHVISAAASSAINEAEVATAVPVSPEKRVGIVEEVTRELLGMGIRAQEAEELVRKAKAGAEASATVADSTYPGDLESYFQHRHGIGTDRVIETLGMPKMGLPMEGLRDSSGRITNPEFLDDLHIDGESNLLTWQTIGDKRVLFNNYCVLAQRSDGSYLPVMEVIGVPIDQTPSIQVTAVVFPDLKLPEIAS